jgi:hypothetical protein
MPQTLARVVAGSPTFRGSHPHSAAVTVLVGIFEPAP